MKTEQKIIKAMLGEKSGFTIRELSKKINSDYKITHTAVNRLLAKDILNKRKVGKSILCSLNRWHLHKEILLAEYERTNEVFRNRDIKQIYKEIISRTGTSLFVMVLFGSFAKGNYHKGSDIDLMFISNEKDFENDINEIIKLIPLKLHILVFNEKEFLRMKLAHEPNVVKEVIENYIILYGIDNFYKLMRK